MATPYSQDLRDRVLAAYDRGMPTQRIAEVFAVSKAWARRLKQRRRETGEIGPRPSGGARVIKIDLARLAELVQEQPDATARELRERLGVACAESAIYMALKRLGLSFKKRRSALRSRTARMSRIAVPRGSPIRRAWIRAG
jgi:transposase